MAGPSNAVHSYLSAIYEGALANTEPTGVDNVTGAPTGGGAWNQLAEVISFQFPDMESSVTNISHLFSPGRAKEFIAGFTDGGQVTLKMNYFAAAMAAVISIRPTTASGRAASNLKFAIVLPDAGVFYCEGFIQKIGGEVPEDDRVTADVTIKVSGLPLFLTF
jgi:hypothetical protein